MSNKNNDEGFGLFYLADIAEITVMKKVVTLGLGSCLLYNLIPIDSFGAKLYTKKVKYYL